MGPPGDTLFFFASLRSLVNSSGVPSQPVPANFPFVNPAPLAFLCPAKGIVFHHQQPIGADSHI